MGILDDFFGSAGSGALVGGTIGFLVGGPVGLAIGAGLGGTLGAGQASAAAQQRQANSALEIARQDLQFQRDRVGAAVQSALPSAAELGAISRLLSTKTDLVRRSASFLDRQEEILAAVDPAIREAGTQALELLQGKQAAILTPLRRDREQRRRDLENQLAGDIGSGFRNSSAGIEALGRFDDETDTLLVNSQQQALTTLLGISVAARPNLAGDISSLFGTQIGLDQSVLAAEQNIENRKLAAITGTNVSSQSLLSASANSQAGEVARQQTLQQLFGTVEQLGGIALGQQLGTPAPPTTAAAPVSSLTAGSPEKATFGQTFSSSRDLNTKSPSFGVL